MESSYGITGAPLNWTRSYITDRKQSVNVCSAKSAKVRLNCGVPQRSVLVPLLFVLYTKDVIDIIKRHGLINHCYADDMQRYLYCLPEELDALVSAFGACTEELHAWMRSNRLKQTELRKDRVYVVVYKTTSKICVSSCSSCRRCNNSTNQWCT